MARFYGNACNHAHIDLIVTETSTNIETNTSEVSWAIVGWLDAAVQSYWYSNAYHAVSVNIDGRTVFTFPETTNKPIGIGTNTSEGNYNTFFSGTATVTHDTDGTKNCPVSMSMVYRWGNGYSWSASGSLGLSQIPRMSQPSCITWPGNTQDVGDMGSTIVIHTNRVSGVFGHILRWQWAGMSGQIADHVGDNATWKIPIELASEIPNAVSGTGVIYCDTYLYDTYIGTKQCLFTATVPQWVVPSISKIDCTDPTGLLSKYGGYVQGKSKAKIVPSASGIYGSSIATCVIGANGANYYTKQATTSELWTAGENQVSVTVTDSRGRSATATANISVMEYHAPQIASFYAYRCNSDGAANGSGAYMRVMVQAAITALNNKNGKTYTLQHKKTTTTSYTTKATETSTYQLNAAYTIPAETASAFDVKLTVKDDFATVVDSILVNTVFKLMNFRASGKGVAFGKYAESDDLESAMDIRGYKDVYANFGESNQISLNSVSNELSRNSHYYNLGSLGLGGVDVLNLPQGYYWYDGTLNGHKSSWYVEVSEWIEGKQFRLLKAYDAFTDLIYICRCNSGAWTGWKEYRSVNG